MKIGIDIMGGDYGPEQTVAGAIKAHEMSGPDVEFVLFGNRLLIEGQCAKQGFNTGLFTIVDSKNDIQMGDHPARAFQEKSESSIVLGFKSLARREIDGFASTGNTGAMLVGASMIIKTIDGILRPAISTILPRMYKKQAIMLDVGINPDCKPEHLFQYGILGSVTAEKLYGIENPRVGLLNIGTEPGKGSVVAKAAFEKMSKTQKFNFIGNIEGFDILGTDKADVVVCDGFTGNVILKHTEAFYKMTIKRGIHDAYFDRFDFNHYGGTPILGVKAPVIVGHGVSKARAISQMIISTINMVKSNISQQTKELVSHG